MKKCELCDSLAKMYCESDQAILCWDCDSRVHGANFLVAKHLRTLLCHLCQSPTPWTGSGPKLGPTVSVCENCVNRNGSREEINAEETRDEDDDDYGDDIDDLDEEEDDSSEEDDGGDSGDDEENQVVPLSSTMPPVSSSSTSEECSGGCGNGDTQGSGPRSRKVQPLKRMRGTVDPSSRLKFAVDRQIHVFLPSGKKLAAHEAQQKQYKEERLMLNKARELHALDQQNHEMAKSDEKRTLNKGPWSAEEDRKLIAYITRYGISTWSQMAKPAGLQRSGKSCRLRWVNYLRPGLKHGNFTREEVETILDLHQKLGNRWSVIASRLPGRTDNEIKNYWNTHLSRRLKHNLMPKSESFQTPIVETEPKSSSEIVLPPANAPEASFAETSGAIQLLLPNSNLAGEIDQSQTFGELQSILEQSFTAQGSYNEENSEATYAELEFL